METLMTHLFQDVDSPDIIERENQKYFVHRLHKLLEDEDTAMEIKGLALHQVKQLEDYLEEQTMEDDEIAAHYDYLKFQIDTIFEVAD